MKIQKIILIITIILACATILVSSNAIITINKLYKIILNELSNQYNELTINNYTKAAQFIIITNYTSSISSFGLICLSGELIISFVGIVWPINLIVKLIKELRGDSLG